MTASSLQAVSPNRVDGYGMLYFTAESAENAETIKENLCDLCVLCGKNASTQWENYRLAILDVKTE